MPDKNAPAEREPEHQNPLIHEGVDPDPDHDGNERADERVKIVEPDGSPSPRAEARSKGWG